MPVLLIVWRLMHLCRLYRRYARRRFGLVDAQRLRFARSASRPQTSEEWVKFWPTVYFLYYCNTVIRTCLTTVVSLREADDFRDDDLQLVVAEFRRSIDQTPYLLFTKIIEYAAVQGQYECYDSAVIQLSGWMRTQISLSLDLKLWKALSERGKSPSAVLLERLPAAVYLAWRDRDTSDDLKKMRKKVVSLLKADAPQSHGGDNSDHLVPPGGSISFAHQLEADDVYRAWLKRTGLTALEEAVTHLQVQEYTDQEIAQKLDRTLWSVKTAWRRAKKKLAETAPH